MIFHHCKLSDKKKAFIFCSATYGKWELIEDKVEIRKPINFCPYCGAKLDE